MIRQVELCGLGVARTTDWRAARLGDSQDSLVTGSLWIQCPVGVWFGDRSGDSLKVLAPACNGPFVHPGTLVRVALAKMKILVARQWFILDLIRWLGDWVGAFREAP